MNNYYAPVNILSQDKVFADPNFLKNISIESNKFLYDKNVLSSDILNFFNNINIDPKFVVVFAKNDHQGVAERRWIHSDVYLSEDRKWEPITCGINWEVSDNISSEFSWYDMSELPECYPSLENENCPFNGIHYIKPRNAGVPSNAKLLCKTKIIGPTLIRTDIPHLVTFKPKQILEDNLRISFSIRFEETWSNWEECLKAFQPIIKSD
jgi:hypothetical protein